MASAPSRKDQAFVDAWANETADEIVGNDLLDKEELVNKPFMIRGVQFRTSATGGYEMVNVDAELPDGTMIQFSDSSATGVKGQLHTYLTEKGFAGQIDAEEPIAINIKCLRGLRKSTWTAIDGRGKSVPAKAFYIRLKPSDK